MQIEDGRERSRPLRLINPCHQHPSGDVAPKLDFADGKVKLGGGIVGRRGHGMRSAWCERASGGQTDCAGRSHRLENLAPRESVHVRLLSKDLLPARIADVGLRRQNGSPRRI